MNQSFRNQGIGKREIERALCARSMLDRIFRTFLEACNAVNSKQWIPSHFDDETIPSLNFLLSPRLFTTQNRFGCYFASPLSFSTSHFTLTLRAIVNVFTHNALHPSRTESPSHSRISPLGTTCRNVERFRSSKAQLL